MKVLLTGANGFVGSHIAEDLLEKGHQVEAVVRQTSNLKWIKDLPIFYQIGSLNDELFLEKCIGGADIVIHCAGAVRAMRIEDYFKANTASAALICKTALKINANLKKIIFISSQAAMGPSDSKEPKSLAADLNPVSDYGLSKLEAERKIREILKGKIPYTILRPASVYGPRDKDIFIFFNLVHKHLKPVTIKERFIQLVYVKDIAKAVCASIDNAKSDDKTYYLAAEKPFLWKEVAETIAKGAKKWTIPLFLPDFVFKMAGFCAQIHSKFSKKPAVLNNQKIIEMLQRFWIADTKPAKDDLGIVFTEFETGSEITYNWYVKNGWF